MGIISKETRGGENVKTMWFWQPWNQLQWLCLNFIGLTWEICWVADGEGPIKNVNVGQRGKNSWILLSNVPASWQNSLVFNWSNLQLCVVIFSPPLLLFASVLHFPPLYNRHRLASEPHLRSAWTRVDLTFQDRKTQAASGMPALAADCAIFWKDYLKER